MRVITNHIWRTLIIIYRVFPLDHIGLHIRAVGEWTNRLLNFFEKEQTRLHNGEIPEYDDQVAADINCKHNVIEAYVTNSKCDKVDERSDGSNMNQHMAMANKQVELIMNVKKEKSMSMPDIDNNIKNSERFKK